MKKLLIILSILIFCFLIGIPLYLKMNECEKCNLNYDNILKVSKGMKYKDVLTIMGTPMKVDTPSYNPNSIFITYYETPAGMSDDIGLGITMKDSTIKYINKGE